MKKQLTHISVHQTSKVFAILYFILFALFAIPMGIFTALTVGVQEGLLFFAFPFLYGVFMYIMFAILAFFYNLVASSFGGVEFSFKDAE